MSGRNAAMQTFCLCASLRGTPTTEKRLFGEAQPHARTPGLTSRGIFRLPLSLPKQQPHRTCGEERSVAVGAAATAAAPVAAAAASAAPGSELLIGFATAYALPIFGLMLFAPHWEKTQELLGSLVLFLPLAVVYFYLLVVSWQPDTLNLMMPGNVQDGMAGKPQFFPQLEPITRLFGRLTTAASVWVHILTINLFTARFCYFRGLAKKIPSFHTILVATFFGPLALLSLAITESVWGRSDAKTTTESVPSTASSSSGNGENASKTATNVAASISKGGMELPNGSHPLKASDSSSPTSTSSQPEKFGAVAEEALGEVSLKGAKEVAPSDIDSGVPAAGVGEDMAGPKSVKIESGSSVIRASGTVAEEGVNGRKAGGSGSSGAVGAAQEAAVGEGKSKKGSKHLFSKLFGSQDEEGEVIRHEGGNTVLRHDGGCIILEPYIEKKR